MAQMANLLIKDDAATPIEYTFVPITDNPVPFWRTGIAGVPIEGQMRLTFGLAKLKNQGYKVWYKMEVPVMETLGASGTSSGYVAPPKVAYVTTGIFTMFVDRRSSIADRANAMKITKGVADGCYSVTGGGSIANASAGDTFKTTSRPGTDLFINLILPN